MHNCTQCGLPRFQGPYGYVGAVCQCSWSGPHYGWGYPVAPIGWECPKCKNVYAPNIQGCWTCNNIKPVEPPQRKDDHD